MNGNKEPVIDLSKGENITLFDVAMGVVKLDERVSTQNEQIHTTHKAAFEARDKLSDRIDLIENNTNSRHKWLIGLYILLLIGLITSKIWGG